MIILVNVVISNYLDDSTKNVIVAFDSSDKDTLNYLDEMIPLYVNVDLEYEKIHSYEVIRPINISSNPDHYDLINDKMDFRF